MIPTDSAIKLLRHAREHGVPITADDFLPIDLAQDVNGEVAA